MLILVSAIVALGIVVAIIALLSRSGNEQPTAPAPSCATCSGSDSRCEQECMMEAATKDIVYYDDEQLDIYAGRPSDSYTDEEIETFAEVLYTLLPQDAKGWNRSLILRGINIPNQLKDELIQLVSEQ